MDHFPKDRGGNKNIWNILKPHFYPHFYRVVRSQQSGNRTLICETTTQVGFFNGFPSPSKYFRLITNNHACKSDRHHHKKWSKIPNHSDLELPPGFVSISTSEIGKWKMLDFMSYFLDGSKVVEGSNIFWITDFTRLSRLWMISMSGVFGRLGHVYLHLTPTYPNVSKYLPCIWWSFHNHEVNKDYTFHWTIYYGWSTNPP